MIRFNKKGRDEIHDFVGWIVSGIDPKSIDADMLIECAMVIKDLEADADEESEVWTLKESSLDTLEKYNGDNPSIKLELLDYSIEVEESINKVGA